MRRFLILVLTMTLWVYAGVRVGRADMAGPPWPQPPQGARPTASDDKGIVSYTSAGCVVAGAVVVSLGGLYFIRKKRIG